MSSKRCCEHCFGDQGLAREIIPVAASQFSEANRIGDCSYCGASNILTVHPCALAQWFEIVVDCYVVDPDGDSLVSLLKEDWQLFRHPRMDEAHVKELLSDIFDDGQFVRQAFRRVEFPLRETPQRWEDLRDELMHRNRWFLDQPLDLEQLAELLAQLLTPKEVFREVAEFWYRARLNPGTEPFALNDMGAPPANRAGHGRANPAGIPYLYLGSTQETAVAEIRPHTGEMVSIAVFTIAPVQVVDLRAPRVSTSPFLLEDAEQMAALRAGLPLLERLGLELTKPIQPLSAPFEYIPSQYLCEFMKSQGYDGVLYRSSVSDGVNLALFNPDLALGTEVHQALVSRVTVDIATKQ